MATIYRNPALSSPATPQGEQGYTNYREPDTRIPPKASPIIREIAVNGVAIPETEILAEAQNHPAENPGAALKAAAQALVIREILVQEARRLGIAAERQSDAAGRMETEADAAIRALIEQEVQTPSASTQECRHYYERHQEKFRSEPLFEARHILLAASPTDSAARDEARKRALAICQQLAGQPELFSILAREYSQCPSRQQGGNLGQIGPGSTVAEFENALSNMNEGQISDSPVESKFGFHIIALDRKIEGRILPFELVSDRIAAWLEASVWSKAVSQYISVIAGRADISGDVGLTGADGPLVQ